MNSQTTAAAMVESRAAHGINTVFGVPGAHDDPLSDALHGARGRIRVLHARHEQAGAHMAPGAALATGRPQADAAVPGPGIPNIGAALLTALGMGAPVLATAAPHWSISPDGSRARLGFADGDGGPCRIELPVEAASGLLMTLPRILQAAPHQRGDAKARIVQPLGPMASPAWSCPSTLPAAAT